MLLVQACFIPDMGDEKITLVCETWLDRLQDRLDERQFGYLEKLRKAKFGPTIFAGRLLSRLMLCSAFPTTRKIYSNEAGLPSLEKTGYAICFSYSSFLAASALFAPACPRETTHFAMDVEYSRNIANDNGPFYSVRHLKNWLKFEIALKAAPQKPSMAKMNKISIKKREDFTRGSFWHRFVAVPGHIIGIGANVPFSEKMTLELVDIRKLV